MATLLLGLFFVWGRIGFGLPPGLRNLDLCYKCLSLLEIHLAELKPQIVCRLLMYRSPRLACCGIGLAQHHPASLDRTLAFPSHGHHWSRVHVRHKSWEEWPGCQIGVVLPK